MDAVTPREEVLGSGAGGPLSPPSKWISYAGYILYPYGVVIGNPSGGNKGIGALNLQSIYINGTLVDLSKYFLLTGGTLTGSLTLASDPTTPLGAATKQYVDGKIVTVNANFANYLPLAGGTLAGMLTLSADPTTALHAATKEYVDNKITGLISVPDAPQDGTNYGRKNGTWVDTSQIDVGTY
jgi:hypothetical protein